MIPGLDGRPAGLAEALGVRGRVRVRLAMRIGPTGFLGRSTALRGRDGTGTTPRRCSVTALPLTIFRVATISLLQL